MLTPSIQLIANRDGTYDLLLDYPRGDAEFAKSFGRRQETPSDGRTLAETIRDYAKRFRIKSVRILIAGALVATMALSAFLSVFGASDRYTMGYLYNGTDLEQIGFVNETGGALDVVSPSYFDIRSDGSLKLNYLSPYLIKSMHDKGIRVVPFLSNHWNRTAGINALKDVETLSDQIAEYVEEYDLDGINVDIENVTHKERDAYTELVRLLREKIPKEKEVSVAVAVNPNNWQTGWHGSYDYAALAKYADHLLIMAYDEHYEGGEAGPVASIDFVEKSIQYALKHTTPDKIVLGVPFFGRVWSLDNNRIVGKGAGSNKIQEILSQCASTVTYDKASESVRAEFTVTDQDGSFTVGSGVPLTPGRYVAWFENDRSYRAKLNLIQKYNLKGAGAWSLGQEDTAIWEHYESWIDGGGGSVDTTPPPATTPPSPEETPGVESAPETPSDGDETPTPDEPLPDSDELPPSGEPDFPGNPDLPDGPLSPDNPALPPTRPPAQDSLIHVVRPGDTLWGISQLYLGSGIRYREIMEQNGLTSDRIYPGMALKISPNTEPEEPLPEYVVKEGDTLWKIARTELGNGSRYREIMELNGLTNDLIRPGQILRLPPV